MRSKGLLLLMLPLIMIGGCKKDKNDTVPDLTGTFSGKFIMTVPSTAAVKDSVQFTLQAGKFESAGVAGIITTGGGKFTVNANMANFTDLEALPDNATINKNAILTGSYNYRIKGDSLLLTKTDDQKIVFNYKLKKR